MTPSTTSRTPRRDARANRDSILSAAREILARDPHASIDLIARHAGLTRRALYGHFEDRAALVRELIAAGAPRFNAVAERVTDDDSRLALARLAALLWEEAAHIQVAASIALDDAHVAATAAALAPLRRTVSAIVVRGQRSGELRQDVGAAELARLIEETARMVVIRTGPTADAGTIAVRAVLSIAGLSWREADALLADHPDLGAPGLGVPADLAARPLTTTETTA